MTTELEPVSYHVASEPRSWDELRAEVVAVILDAAADSGQDGLVLGTAADFADAVLSVIDDEALTRMADRLVGEVRFRSLEIREGRLDMTGIEAREIAATWVGASRALLTDAENYSEIKMQFTDFDREQAYAFTAQKVGRHTPHELRRQAEAERDEARAEADRLREQLAENPLNCVPLE